MTNESKSEPASDSLLDQALWRLQTTNLSLKQIADGADVDVNWLAKFKQRDIKEPGVMKVQRVHDFLAAYDAIRIPRQNSSADTAA